MKEIKTKFGTLYYYREKRNKYVICDSDEWTMFVDFTKSDLKEFIRLIKSCETIDDFLKNYEDVCWGSYDDIFDFTLDYQTSNGRKFDKKWLDEHYNKIGDCYVLFEYSDCYK